MGLTRFVLSVLLLSSVATFGQQAAQPQSPKEPDAATQAQAMQKLQQSVEDEVTQAEKAAGAMLARFAYRRTDGMEQSVCLAVAKDGSYQIIREEAEGPRWRMRGELPEKDLQALKAMIDDPGLRRLPESRGGLIRGESETFHAEIWAPPSSDSKINDLTPNGPGGYLASPATRHIRWQNADGQNPFPAPVEKIVDWLKNFHTTDGRVFEHTELEQVCPSQGLSYVRPSVAENSLPR
jgi:hypothetical protein